MNRSILVLVDDLFWKTKIDHAVKSAQRSAQFLADPSELADADPENVGAVLVDLSLKKEPFSFIAALKQKAETRGIPVIGFYEHVRKDLQKKGLEAGCDEVLSRSMFSEKMGDLILKYMLPGGVRTAEDEPELPEE